MTMCDLRDHVQVVGVSGLECGLGKGDEGGLIVHHRLDGSDGIGGALRRHHLEGASHGLGRTSQHVDVGGEVGVIGDHFASALRSLEHGHGELVQIHRRGVRDDHLARGGADQRGDTIAELELKVPPSLVPGSNQSLAPCLLHLIQPGRRRHWQTTEGIAVEIDEVRVFEMKLRSEHRQGIGAVEVDRLGVAAGFRKRA
jgi:hypothetical protein